jgi:hypothetical protein
MKVSSAGMFLLKAMLRDIGFDEAIKEISNQGLRFSPLNFAYTLVWMTVNDVDAPYQLNEMDLSNLEVLLTLPKPPLKDDCYDFYGALTEDECEALVDELARCYQRAGLINGFVIFFDNHTIPYYGGVPIGFVYHATRNMPIRGIHLAQLNDINGNFILFKLVPSTTEFADILIELIERMKRVLNITTPLILVVDREAEALSLFQELNRRRICFIVVITKNSKITEEMASISESEFKDEFREKEKIMETEISLKGVPFRAGVILHEDGKRYGFRTNIPKKKVSNIQEIAALIPTRWRQENKFEEIKNGEHGDKIARYEFIDAPNVHLQKRYEKLQEQLPKVEARIKQQKKELEGLRERYEKKEGIFKERLQAKDEAFMKLERSLRKAGEREVFQGRLQKKIDARDVCIQKYSTALSELENRMGLVTGKLKKELARKEKIMKELENIDLEAKFFQLNTASTTFNIAVKEAVANANSELIVELAPIRNRALRKRFERLCNWLTEKRVDDTDGKRLVFKVGTT